VSIPTEECHILLCTQYSSRTTISRLDRPTSRIELMEVQTDYHGTRCRVVFELHVFSDTYALIYITTSSVLYVGNNQRNWLVLNYTISIILSMYNMYHFQIRISCTAVVLNLFISAYRLYTLRRFPCTTWPNNILFYLLKIII